MLRPLPRCSSRSVSDALEPQQQQLAKLLSTDHLLAALKQIEGQGDAKNKSRLLVVFCADIRGAITGEKPIAAALPKRKLKQLKRLESFLERKSQSPAAQEKEKEKEKARKKDRAVARRAASLRQ